MERRIGLLASLSLVLATALSACGSPKPEAEADPAEAQEDDWMTTPRIFSVSTQGDGGVLVRGVAAPRARVILSGTDGPAVAAGADAQGRFELHVGAAATGQVLTPEIQIGQTATPGPQRLLVVGEGRQAAALLTDGGPSLRLTPGPALDALDGDGRGLIASGRADPGQKIVVRAGGMSAQAVADSRGRWVAPVATASDRGGDIEVDGTVFHYAGPGAPAAHAERAGEGWRITRGLSGSAYQTTWLPD